MMFFGAAQALAAAERRAQHAEALARHLVDALVEIAKTQPVPFGTPVPHAPHVPPPVDLPPKEPAVEMPPIVTETIKALKLPVKEAAAARKLAMEMLADGRSAYDIVRRIKDGG